MFRHSIGVAKTRCPQRLQSSTWLRFTTLERTVISSLHKFFRPKLIGRFDEKIVFKLLCPNTQR
jgi:ATP-dependent Clp protease ATP-binding subunit ClpA